MPVISTGRYSTSSSSAASYLSPSGSTVGTYRSSYDSGRPSYSNYTSGTSSSAYRSTYSTYRSGLSDTHLTSSSRYGSSSSGYGVSRDKVSSLLPPTPPSSITNRRSESRQRDLISNNKDYTTTNSTLSSTLKTANSLNRLSRFGSSTGGVERSSSLARNLATCGVDLYEKYSPSTYVGPSSKSSYVPKTELTRSRSLSEASKFFVNNNNTPTLSNNSPYNNYISNNNNNNNNNNNSNDGTTAATTTTGDDVGSSGARNGEKPHQPNSMITNLSRNKGFMSNESLNKTHRNNTANNFNLSSYKNENFLKNECELARREVLLQNQKQQKQQINDNLKINNLNKPLTIFDINNPTKQSADQHKRSHSNKMMNGLSTNGQVTSRIDDDIKFIDSDEVAASKSSTEMKKRVEHQQNGVRSGRHRSCESSELNKITQKILNKNQPAQQARGRDKSKTAGINRVLLTKGSSDEEIKFIDSDDLQQQNLTKSNTNPNTSSLTQSPTPPLPSSLLTNSHHSKNHLINNLNTKNNINHKCDKVNSNRSNTNHLNSSTESIGQQHHHQLQPKSSLMEKVESPLKTSTVTVTITPKKSTMAATSVTASSAASTTTCDDVNLTNLLIDNNKLTNKLNDESLRGTSSLRNALPPTSSSSSLTNRSWDRDRDSGLSSSSSSAYRSTLGSRDYSDGYTSKRSSLLSSSIDRERKSSVTEHTEGLCGLWNIGNTCFMNSVVQCLSHTSELTKYLRNQSSGTRSSSSERKDQRIFNEFVKLIKEMWSASSRSVNPSEFKMALSSKYRMYSGSTQQDAQEFLRFFLDSLHTAMNTAQKADPVTLIDDMSDTKKADLMWDWYSKTENSVIKDLFVGQLRSTLKCSTCGNTSVTFDPFWDLSLPLPSNTRCKLENCLELFIKEEIMDGDEMPNCSKCKTRRKSTKTFTIQRFPKYLVIHLKRFSETRWSKLTNIVEFPTGERELNLAPYASDKTATCLYSLYGISNHMGSTAGGHYVAACKHASTKKWHEFNDNSVSDASESSLVSSSAYLLFFERV